MKWLNVSSLEELKTLGKFKDVSALVKSETKDKYKINCKGWQTLYDSILEIQKSNKKQDKPKEAINEENPYFNSLASEYIFYLIELDGEIRMKKLGITPSHFKNKKKAKAWRDKISKNIHPDKCKHIKSEDAMAKLNSMYESMTSNVK